MVSLRRVESITTGLAGSPYFTQHYFVFSTGDTTPIRDAVVNFWTALKPQMVSGTSVTVQGEQTIIEDTTGAVVDVEVGAPASAVTGTGTGTAHPTAIQGLMRLRTDNFVVGRRLQGRLYIPGATPSSGAAVPAAAYINALGAAGNALVTASAAIGAWCVWSRPQDAKTPAEDPPDGRPARAGSHGVIVSADGAPKWAVLRSRRD